MRRSPWPAAWLLAVSILPGGEAAASSRTPRPSAPSAPADTVVVTLEEAARRALRDGPLYRTSVSALDAARGERLQAGALAANPDLEVRALELDRGIPGRARGFELSVEQSIPVAGQRGLGIRVAELAVSRADAERLDVGRLVLADLSRAFHGAVAATEKARVASEIARAADRLAEAAEIRFREGEISAMDASLARMEAARAAALGLGMEGAASTARVELGERMGVPAGTPIRIDLEPGAVQGLGLIVAGWSIDAPPSAAALDSLVDLALSRRPDLLASEHELRQYRALASLARRNRAPDLRLAFFLEREVAEGGPPGSVPGEPIRAGLGLGLPLPLFQRNSGAVAAADAEAEQAGLRWEAAHRAAASGIARAVESYRVATAQAAAYRDDVVAPARENLDRLEGAFQEGRLDLPTLLLLRSQLLDAELGYWDAWLGQRDALTELASALGLLDPTHLWTTSGGSER